MKCRWKGGAAWASCLLLSSLVFAQTPLDELEKRIEGLPEPAAAAREPAYLGLVADETLTENGVRVTAVYPRGPAATAGVEPGDIITAIGGTPVRSLDEMQAVVSAARPGQMLDFDVRRGIRRMSLRMRLGRRPGAASPPAAADASRPTLGVIVTPLTAEGRTRFRLGVASGAVVTSVEPGSAAADAGIVPGAAIVALDGRRIDNPDQLVAAIAGLKPGDEVELTYYIGGDLHRERARLTAPTPAPGAGAAEAPRAAARPPLDSPAEEFTALKREMAELQGRMAELQTRLEALEARLPKE